MHYLWSLEPVYYNCIVKFKTLSLPESWIYKIQLLSTWTKPLYQYSHMVLFVFSIGRNEISTSLLITFWFCWFCQCTLGSERGKTSITHIPSRHAPLSYWHIKGSNRWASHDTKVVTLLLHPSYSAMKRFHVQHKAVYSPTEPIHFVYWKCTSSPGSHPTENRCCRKDGIDWICALRRFSFYCVCFYLPLCENSD